MDVKQKPYLASIIKKYNWLYENDTAFYLHDLNEGIVKEELFQLVQVYEKLPEEDQVILKNYIEIQDKTKLLVELTKKAESLSKNISRLLSGKTQDPQKRGLLNMCALLLNIQPRPFDRNYDYSNIKLEKISKPSKAKYKQKETGERKSKFHFSVIVVLAIVAISFFYTICIQNTNKSSSPITIHTKNFTVSDINRIFPDTTTKFFDTDQQPIVWYTTHNNEPEFYNTAGLHPTSGKQLKPVNKEVIREFIVLNSGVINDGKENTNDTTTTRQRNKNTTAVSLNTSVVNTKEHKELSVFIFDSISNLETDFTTHLKEQLGKDYVITQQLIPTNQLTKQRIATLFQGDVKKLSNDLHKYTDYLCIGKVTYEFKQSAVLKTKQICTLSIQYTITDVNTGTIIKSYSNSITGNGSTKSIAKRNTIKKITL
ncbi:hypothetical protein [uncultured Kordia sp.]|uniref:hypothetical protein n=1 Tax=uncultured Kordia sp. TaxID=507699 RepID=UPI0026334396|nr:hypothetical protein [uncultured Kordia sp.]